MSDESAPTHGFCKRCLIAYEADSVFHEDEQDCIAHLKLALKKSRERERSVGFAVATRMIGVLEELVHRPEAGGVDYKVFTSMGPNGKGVVGGSIEERAVPAAQISGIFAALLSMYERMGDWSPLEAERERADEMQLSATTLLKTLQRVELLLELDSPESLAEAREEVRSALGELPRQALEELQFFADRMESLPG